MLSQSLQEYPGCKPHFKSLGVRASVTLLCSRWRHASHLLIDIGTLDCQLYTLSCSLVQKGQVILVMITDPQTTVQTTWGQCVVAFAELTYDRRQGGHFGGHQTRHIHPDKTSNMVYS